MGHERLHGLAQATRLTRQGKLTDATALIQRLLRPDGSGDSARPAEMPRNVTALGSEPAPAPTTEPKAPPEWRGRLRRGLGETLRDLAARARPPGRVTEPCPEILPDGASFAVKTFTNHAGSREYRLYVPASNRSGQKMPLVVMLHGCTQSPEDFAAGTRMNALAEEHGLLICYPAQPASANANKCWNWFNGTDQRRGDGEPALIAGITRQVIDGHGADPRRVYVAGLSAGGAAAAIMGVEYPELYAGIGVHSGLAAGSASDLPSALAAMRNGASGSGARIARAIVFHGDQDATVHPRNGQALVEQTIADDAGVLSSIHRGEKPGGRAYTRTIFAEAAGRTLCEHWVIHGAGHAWAGGSAAGSHTDPQGPDATREMIRFFLEQPH